MSKRQPPQQIYCELMGELKARDRVLSLMFASPGALAEGVLMEAACIQLRKMLELVAFASLVANKDVYAKVQADLAKHWKAQLLLKDLERVNPHFYPAPMVQERSDRPDVKWHVRDVKDGFMTGKSS